MKKLASIIFCALIGINAVFAQASVEVTSALEKSAKEISSILPSGSKIAVATFFSDSKELTSYLSQEMVKRLSQKNTLTVIERNEKNMSLLDAETEYQYSGNVSDDSMVEIGYKLGAQYLVYGAFEQFGGMMQLTVQVTNVETAEIPYMTSYSISKSSQITDLLGEDIELVTADDYLDAIARCQKKITAIEKDKSKAIQNQKSKITATYQQDINKIKAQSQEPWESKEEYNKRINSEVSTVEKKRDIEISGVEKSVSINYDSQIKQIEIQLDKLKKDLQNTTFVLNGDSVQVLVGSFNREAKPKNWPVSIKSLDKKISYTYNGQYTVNDADVKTEYTIIEDIRTQNAFAGEITYKITEAAAKNTYNIFIVNVRLYNDNTGITILNEGINKNIGTMDITNRAVGTSSSTKSTKTAVKEKTTSKNVVESKAVASSSGTTFDEVNKLIKKNLFKNQGKIIDLSKSLSESEKQILYDDYEKGKWGPACLNLLPFAIGSFKQKDMVNAWIITSLDALSIYLIINDFGDPESDGTGGTFGICAFMLTRIYAVVHPFFYANKYNKTLSACLDVNGTEISFVPLINPINNQYGVALSMSF